MKILILNKYFFISDFKDFLTATQHYPEHKETLILSLINSNAADKYHCFFKAIIEFKDYRVQLIDEFLDCDVFWQYLPSLSCLQQWFIFYPECREKIFKKIKRQAAIFFKGLNYEHIMLMIKSFDEQSIRRLFDIALEEDQQSSIFWRWKNIIDFLTIFPDYIDQFYEKLFSQGKPTLFFFKLCGYEHFFEVMTLLKIPEKQLLLVCTENNFFLTLMEKVDELLCFIQANEHFVEPAFKQLLSDDETFQRLINNGNALARLALICPQFSYLLAEKILKNPLLLRSYVVNTDYNNSQLIGFSANMGVVTQTFPAWKEQFSYVACKSPSIFRQSIFPYDFKHYSKIFSNPLYRAVSYDSACKKVAKSYLDIRKTTRILALLRKKQLFFRDRLDAYITVNIAAFTGDPDVHNAATSCEVAREAYNELF